jgi:hypothetical protein
MPVPSKALAIPTPEPAWKGQVKYVAQSAASVAGWHLKHVPGHLWRVTRHATRGLVVVTPPFVRWVFALDKGELVSMAQAAGNVRVAKECSDARTRALVIRNLLWITGTLVAASQIYKYAGYAGLSGAGALLLLILAFVGARAVGESVTEGAPPRRGELSQQRLDDALQAIKVLNKPRADGTEYGTSVMMRGLPYRYNNGTRVRFDIPPGAAATVSTLQEKRELLAGQLGVHDRMLVIQEGDSAASVDLWVADEDPLNGETVISPYTEAKRARIWEGARIGIDPMGEEIRLDLIQHSVGLGGLPRQGKSNVARLLAVPGILDPDVQLYAVDGKGGIDLEDLRRMACGFVSFTDEDPVERTIAIVEELEARMWKNMAIIKEHKVQHFPEGRITPEAAELFDMKPAMLIVDEMQLVVERVAAETNAGRLLQPLMNLLRTGPAAGIVCITVFHRPDAKSIPTAVMGTIHTQIATRCADRRSSDYVLGEGAAAAGWNAAKLPNIPGAGIVKTLEQGGTFAKFDYLPLAEFERLCERGYQLRAANNALPEQKVSKKPAEASLIDKVEDLLRRHEALTASQIAEKLGLDTDPRLLGRRLRSWGFHYRKTSSNGLYSLK